MLTKFNLPGVKKIEYRQVDITNAVVYFPLIGLVYGFVLFYTNILIIFFCIPDLFKAGIILALPFIFNNFFHFDGLCDLLDGFLANKPRDERLRIMKDSSVGSFALGGAILFFLFKYLGLFYLLLENDLAVYLVIIPVFSRFIMMLLAFKSKYPREKGTASLIVGKIGLAAFLASCMIFISIIAGFLLFAGKAFLIHSLIMILAMSAVTIIFYLTFKFYSYGKIGGITGDVLGASSEISELILIYVIIILNGRFALCPC